VESNSSPDPSGAATGESDDPQSATHDPRSTASYRIAALASRTDDPTLALREMLGIFVALFKADAGSIGLLSPDSGLLETEVQVGTPDDNAPHDLKLGHGITGWCVLNRRSLLVSDVTFDPRYIAVRPSARCEMAAPIEHEEQVIGVVDLESDRVSGFSPADLTLLETLATEAGRVMQRLWQVMHLKEKARQLESLITAGQSLVTKLEQQELFDTLTREARNTLRARACALYLYEPDTASVRCASFTHGSITAPASGALPIDSCLVASPIHTRHTVWFPDIQSPEYQELLDLPIDPALRSVLASPLLYEGEVLGVVAVFTDRVHRFDNDEKRLCNALASLGSVALQNARLYARVFQSEDVLRKNERLTTLGLLAAEIAHEIRNPLTVLKLLHGGLGIDFAEGDPRRTDMRVIGEKLDQLEAIVTRVLGFAKAPSSLHSRWSLADIIHDTLLLVRLKLAQSKVSLSFEPPPRPLFIEAHKGQIQQVLLNLLLNATQAMPEGGMITLHLTSGGSPGAPQACLDITDTGSGVDAAIRDRIFDSFLSGRPDGTGLGLAIAKRILVSHHGDITLHATGPAGTIMRITLPLAR
jgi:signal transduction histidine kinase